MLKAILLTLNRFAQSFVGTSRQEDAEDNRPGFTLTFALQSVYAPLALPQAKKQKILNVPSEDVPAPLPPNPKPSGSAATPRPSMSLPNN